MTHSTGNSAGSCPNSSRRVCHSPKNSGTCVVMLGPGQVHRASARICGAQEGASCTVGCLPDRGPNGASGGHQETGSSPNGFHEGAKSRLPRHADNPYGCGVPHDGSRQLTAIRDGYHKIHKYFALGKWLR